MNGQEHSVLAVDVVDGLEGRVALVTGSSSGIGEATARRLADLGAHVVVNSSSSVDAGRAVAESLPTESVYVQADVADTEQVKSLLDATIGAFDRLDILVNNAGWSTVVPHDDLAGLSDAIFRRTFEVNVFGTWALTRAAIPHLRQSDDGNVVTVASIAGQRPVGSSIAYAMTKSALIHMTVLLARSHGPTRFNAVAPGLVRSPWTADWDEMHAKVDEIAPLGRASSPDEQAQAIVSCITNRYMTGSVVTVDGGLSLVL